MALAGQIQPRAVKHSAKYTVTRL